MMAAAAAEEAKAGDEGNEARATGPESEVLDVAGAVGATAFDITGAGGLLEDEFTKTARKPINRYDKKTRFVSGWKSI